MSSDSTPSGTATVPTEPPGLRPARFADFPAIHRLESEYFDNIPDLDERRRLFEDHPLWPRLEDTWPLGWILEDADGGIVGAVTNVPTLYLYRGEEKLCANGYGWVTTADHRGYAALLMDEYFEQEGVDLILSSSVGADATAIWRAYGAPVPLGDWAQIAYLVTNRRVFARAVLMMRGIPGAGVLAAPAAGALAVKEALTSRSLPKAPDDVAIVESRGFDDDRFDAFWEELRAQNDDVLLAVRDRQTLQWHFGLPRKTGRLWVYTAIRNGRILAYCAVKQRDRSAGVSSMRLVDFQTVDTSVDLLPVLLRPAAARCASEGNGVLEHLGCGIPKTAGFDRYAPYRTDKVAWSFYVRTPDPRLAAELANPGVWDPSEYDGDASIM